MFRIGEFEGIKTRLDVASKCSRGLVVERLVGELCDISSLLIFSRRTSTGAVPNKPPSSIHHAVLNYSKAAAIITNTLAPPAYMPFRLEAAPM
jgi:hypothetical protein